MRYILNSTEMQQCDENTSTHFQVPSICLMEQAAVAATEEIIKLTKKTDTIAIVCGSGNNGGDGLAIARMLFLKGYSVAVLFVGKEEKCTEQTAQQLKAVKAYEIPIFTDIHTFSFDTYSVIIDAIFGVGINRAIEGHYAECITAINESDSLKISIDIPSGINADNGQIAGCAVKADITITFAFEKLGMYLYPGAYHAGKIILKDIGITEKCFLGKMPEVFVYDKEDLNKLFPSRFGNSNKGSYGKVTFITGSFQMAGAAFLSAMAAYRTGCGLVRIVTPEENRIILQSLIPEAVLTVYDPNNPDEAVIKEAIDWGTVVGIGCGIGTSDEMKNVFHMALNYINKTNKACVLDADALNILASEPDFMNLLVKDTVITPHLGEMARLTGKSINEIKQSLLETATSFSRRWHVCCVLKDARTFVTEEGGSAYLNLHGCNGLATGGSGDVLTGIICGLIALGLHNTDAARTGVLLHGMAGEAARNKCGNSSMLARDILDGITTVLRGEN